MRMGSLPIRSALLYFQFPHIQASPHTRPNDVQSTAQRVSFICTIDRKLAFRFQNFYYKITSSLKHFNNAYELYSADTNKAIQKAGPV